MGLHTRCLSSRRHAAGALKLAGLVQYVPLPVVGGYLCFVGYFCLAAGELGETRVPACVQGLGWADRERQLCLLPSRCAGVSLASGLQVSSLASWAQLASGDALLKLAPALAIVALISLVLHRVRSPFALPALLVAAPLLFYAFLFARGLTLEDARNAGWVSKPQVRACGCGGEWPCLAPACTLGLLRRIPLIPPAAGRGRMAVLAAVEPVWRARLPSLQHPLVGAAEAGWQAAHALFHCGVWQQHGHCRHSGGHAARSGLQQRAGHCG